MRRSALFNSKGRPSIRNAQVARAIGRSASPQARSASTLILALGIYIPIAALGCLGLMLFGHPYLAAVLAAVCVLDISKSITRRR
jgi:hypothetical protein